MAREPFGCGGEVQCASGFRCVDARCTIDVDVDAGALDAGAFDAGGAVDAGLTDAGLIDAGTTDAGRADGGGDAGATVLQQLSAARVLPFDREQTLLTFDLPTGLGLLALGDAGWSPPLVLVPSPQGQPWANAGLGAASTLLDRNRCTFELFLTARRQAGAAVYGTIAVAQPIDETGQPLRFAFPECSRR